MAKDKAQIKQAAVREVIAQLSLRTKEADDNLCRAEGADRFLKRAIKQVVGIAERIKKSWEEEDSSVNLDLLEKYILFARRQGYEVLDKLEKSLEKRRTQLTREVLILEGATKHLSIVRNRFKELSREMDKDFVEKKDSLKEPIDMLRYVIRSTSMQTLCLDNLSTRVVMHKQRLRGIIEGLKQSIEGAQLVFDAEQKKILEEEAEIASGELIKEGEEIGFRPPDDDLAKSAVDEDQESEEGSAQHTSKPVVFENLSMIVLDASSNDQEANMESSGIIDDKRASTLEKPKTKRTRAKKKRKEKDADRG